MRIVTVTLLVALVASGAAGGARAHDARPLSVVVVEQSAGVYRATVRVPPVLDAANGPRVVWPGGCEVRERAALPTELGSTELVACDGGLAGRTIAIDYPVYNPSITTLFRVETGGGVRTAVVPPDQREWVVPEEPRRADVARDYTLLGFEHIWEGPDHLLFVAGLLLLAGGLRRIVLAVTGFTVAHSITLSLAALGVIRVPIEPVEALIALSILFLAAEIARPQSGSVSRRYPVVLSFAFGLLHGLGFASALGEIGLPTGELVTGLLFFNVGVELGQLAFIAVAALLVLAWRTARASAPAPRAAALEARAGLASAYLLGVPAAFWFFERAAAAFA